MNLFTIFISSFFVNNIVLIRFLGLCPWIGVSNDYRAARIMSFAVIFVTVSSTWITWLIYHFILLPFEVVYLRTAVFILVIAGFVQIVEIFLKSRIPVIYRSFGVYLPLITTNCVILGTAFLVIDANYTFIQGTVFAFGTAFGFMLAMVMLAGVRERLETAKIPEALKGAPIAFITASLMSLAFLGLSGLFGL